MARKKFHRRVRHTLLPIAILFLLSGGFKTALAQESVLYIQLPKPQYESQCSVEHALQRRRSVRRYADQQLQLTEISQLLWAAQGATDARGFRTAPSAGALYPLEVYVVAGNVTELSAGIYLYSPERHELKKVAEGDRREALFRAALYQGTLREAPAILVFCAVFRRTTAKYGQRGIQYVWTEVGHASQNVCLQAVSLGLGTVTIGAFNDHRVKDILNCGADQDPLYLMPVGRKVESKD